MQVRVEKVSEVENRLTITVPPEDIKAIYQNRVNEVARTANLKGFRPGKAPTSIIIQQFGKEIYTESLKKVMEQNLETSIKQELGQDVRPVNIRLEPKPHTSMDMPLEYVAVVETFPVINEVAFSTGPIEQLQVTVTEADVENVIGEIRKTFSKDAADTLSDEALVKQLGIESGLLDDLKKEIKQTLEREKDRLTRHHLLKLVHDRLIQENTLVLPPSLIEQEAHRIHDEVYRGRGAHDHHQHSTEELDNYQTQARARLTYALLIGAYAKQAGIQADRSIVEARIAEIAASYSDANAVIKSFNKNPAYINNIEAGVLEEQVTEKLIESVEKVEKVLSYEELRKLPL